LGETEKRKTPGVEVQVTVGVELAVQVGVKVVVEVGVLEAVAVGLSVGRMVLVPVGLTVGVRVAVEVGVAVGVFVGETVGVEVGEGVNNFLRSKWVCTDWFAVVWAWSKSPEPRNIPKMSDLKSCFIPSLHFPDDRVPHFPAGYHLLALLGQVGGAKSRIQHPFDRFFHRFGLL
jgi:hypothetical protein